MNDMHLLNFPIFEKHTSEVLFTSISQVLEVRVCEDWKYKIIGITTDDEKKMTGQINGFYK